MKDRMVNNKKKITIIVALCIIAAFLVVGISYAFWQSTKVQEDKNIVAGGCFEVSLEGENPISLTNTYPLLDEEGQATVPYTFTIKNTCSSITKYDVNLESLVNSTFDSSKIKVMINEDMRLYEDFTETEKYFDNSKDARLLARGSLDKEESVTYNLRIWVDENVTIEDQNKTFDSKIIVKASLDLDEPSITNITSTSTMDIVSITYEANGTFVPAICKWGTEEGAYDNEVSDADANKCNITGLEANTTIYYQICTETGKGSKCIDGNTKTKSLADQVELGDYISMTPTATSYEISKDLTGYSINQTINPSELNLWRVIRKNEDGTVDIVSEYVSSTDVYFSNDVAYLNFVGTLNEIANQYTNEKYVKSARHMGYSNQTEKCTGAVNYNNMTACPADTGYTIDTNLVQTALGTLVGKTPSGTTGQYWLASRYMLMNPDPTSAYWEGTGRIVEANGSVSYLRCFTRLYMSRHQPGSANAFIRPILTLKADIEFVSGDGKSADTAYTLE